MLHSINSFDIKRQPQGANHTSCGIYCKKEHRERMLKAYNKKFMTYPSMAKSESPRVQKKKKRGGTVNGERARSDMVRMIDAEIAVTEERLARLERMRNDALALG